MKFLVVFACALAVASAGYLNGQHSLYTTQLATPLYSNIQNLPVIGANGVPVDTPAVQTAKAAHFAAKAEAYAREGSFVQGVVSPVVANVATPVVSTYTKSFLAPAVAPLAPTYTGPQHLPVIGANGVPVDTPAVQTAKVAHLAAKAEAHARNGDFVQGIVSPVVANVAAPVISTYSKSFVAPAVAPLTPKYTGPQHLPVIGANGVPVDTAAVQSAKAAHNVHKAEAYTRNGDFAKEVVAPVVAKVAGAVSTYSGSVVASSPVYTGPQHLPVIGANGVPVDTPAVQNAKAAHLVAKANARARNGDYVQGVLTPAVSAYAAAPVVSSYTTKTVSPVISTYSSAPVVSTYATKTVSPVISTYASAPVVSTYASAPVVSTYATKTFTPAVTTYSSSPVVSTYATKTITPIVGQISAAYPTTAVLPASVNGVPLETPEVLAAKAKHFAAHAEALSRSRRGVYSPVAYSTYKSYGAYPYSTPIVRYY